MCQLDVAVVPSGRLLLMPQLEMRVGKVEPDVGQGWVYGEGPLVCFDSGSRIEPKHLHPFHGTSNTRCERRNMMCNSLDRR